MTATKPSRRRRILIAIAAVFGLILVVCLIAVAVTPSAPAPSAAPTATAAPTRPPTVPAVTSKSIGTDKQCLFEQAQKPALGLSQVRTKTAPLLPTDARLVRTYNPQNVPELTVDLYSSAWLKQQYPDGPWPGGEAGDFIVIYGPSPTAVTRIVIACGNQP